MSEAASNDLPGAEPIPNTGPVIKATLGAQLAAERQAREWTVEHVASQLNLAPRQIQALESDNYSALPGMASVRGFVRAYAKLLKIDAGPLVAMIAAEQITPTQPLEPKRSVSSAPFSDNRLMSSGRRSSSPRTILVGLVLVLLAIGAFDVERMGGWPVLSQSLSTRIKDVSADSASNSGVQPPAATGEASAANASNSVSESLPAPQAPNAGVEPTASQSGTAIDASKAETTKANVIASPQLAEKPAMGGAPARAEAAVDKPVAPLSGTKNLLVFTVHKDAWIQVRDAHNVLLSRLVKAGSTEQMEVNQPVSVTVGNAAGVDIVFRGVLLETKTDAKSNVARLSLK